MTPTAENVLRLLQDHAVGRASAVQAGVIASIIGASWRDVEHAVEEIRRSGVIVASSRARRPRGLYLPETDSELAAAISSFRSAAISTIRTYNAMKRAGLLRRRAAGQSSLFSESVDTSSLLPSGAQKGAK